MRFLTATLCLIFSLLAIPVLSEIVEDHDFIEIKLSNGVSFEMPRNWKIFSSSTRDALDTLATNEIENLITSSLPFAANLYDDNGSTIGILNVRIYPEMDVYQLEVYLMTKLEVMEIDEFIEENIRMQLPLVGTKVLQWDGTDKIVIGSKLVLHTQYVRSSIKNPKNKFRVNLYRFLDGGKSFTMTLSYQERYSDILLPIIRRIAHGCRYN